MQGDSDDAPWAERYSFRAVAAPDWGRREDAESEPSTEGITGMEQTAISQSAADSSWVMIMPPGSGTVLVTSTAGIAQHDDEVARRGKTRYPCSFCENEARYSTKHGELLLVCHTCRSDIDRTEFGQEHPPSFTRDWNVIWWCQGCGEYVKDNDIITSRCTTCNIAAGMD